MKTMQAKFSISGHFKLVARSGERGERVLAEFDNLITDGGLDRLGTGVSISHCQVGEGNTAPAFSDASLASLKAATNNQVGSPQNPAYTAGPPAFTASTWQFRFTTGTATGNLTEVGVGWATSGSLFSRALILDGGGNPTSITVLADEQLDVFYTLRVYIPGDATGTVVLDGITYDWLLRPSNANSGSNWNPYKMALNAQGAYVTDPTRSVLYSGDIGTSTAQPAGTTDGSAVNPSRSTYVAGTHRIDYTVKFGIGDNIAGGVRCITFEMCETFSQCAHRWQAQFNPKVPKTASQKFELTFRISWARH